ncbi:MAG: ATP-grasp domain-containing protein [Gemmatimonadota bacterium]|nr:ATP-grasp domain-containing protein [Gemmatimonadota bacterium]
MAERLYRDGAARLSDDAAFARLAAAGRARRGPPARLYANSENAIGWIVAHLAGTDLPAAVGALKDKLRFRELLRDVHPDLFFRGGTLSDLEGLDPPGIPFPVVLKPAVGFFSSGVRVVAAAEDWPAALRDARRDVERLGGMYPDAVLGLERYVVESRIAGAEYAFDAYFDGRGEPVILNVLEHAFSGEQDVSDRVYLTSAALVERWRDPFRTFLRELGGRLGLHDFPVHAEVRVGGDGRLRPIEVNPLRFAGLCATDIAHHAYGIDPYAAFLEDRRPDWGAIAARAGRSTWALVVAEVPPDVDRRRVVAVDWDGLAALVRHPREVRRMDWRRYPAFAFVFAEAPDGDPAAFDAALRADLRPLLRVR